MTFIKSNHILEFLTISLLFAIATTIANTTTLAMANVIFLRGLAANAVYTAANTKRYRTPTVDLARNTIWNMHKTQYVKR